MPMEMRKLAFTQDELQAALVNYALRTDMKLPHTNVDKLVVQENKARTSAAVALVYPTDPETEKARRVVFTEAQTAAAIIMYCRAHGIPLPRKARKILSAENNSVAIIMSLDWDKVEPSKT